MTASIRVEVLDRVFYSLLKSNRPEAILKIFSTPEESRRFDELSVKNEEGNLSPDEYMEMHQFMLAERYVRLAKAHAFAQLNGIDFE